MRAVFVASVFALVLPVTSCSIDVQHRDRDHTVELPVYPDARAVTVEHASAANISFTGSFADTDVVPRTFESDDAPGLILDFYRQILRARGAVVECRGDINVRRRRGVETLECLERPSSPAVQLAGGEEGNHSVVVVTTHGSLAQFAVLDVHTAG